MKEELVDTYDLKMGGMEKDKDVKKLLKRGSESFLFPRTIFWCLAEL